jgi:hypothetical protein
MQKLLRAILLILIGQIAFLCKGQVQEQNFEGEVLFIKHTLKDTSYLCYKIKGDKVRFEELDKDFHLVNLLIVNLSEKNIFTINPKKKLYAGLPVHAWNETPNTTDFEIIKTGNYKDIKEIRCYQWRVINKKENTEVQYWTAESKFSFFPRLLKLLNQSEKASHYYLNAIPINGLLPLETVERSTFREMRMRLEVVNIEKKTMQPELFEIPSGYKMFEKN